MSESREEDDHGLRFLFLLEFNVEDADEAEPVGDDEEDIQVAGGNAA